MHNLWLALDVGTTSTKAALMEADGRIVLSVESGYPLHTPEVGLVEQDANDWWRAVVDVCHQLSLEDNHVDAVVVTGQMQNVILVDSDAVPVRPVILYSDMRAQVEAEAISAQFGNTQLRQWTGNDQAADGLLAKILWLARHEPESLDQSTHLLPGAADYITLRMTGVAVCDSTTASTTGLMNIGTRETLDHTVFESLGLGQVARQLPPITPGGAKVGSLTVAAAAQLSLPQGIPVYHGPGDAGAATLGAGCGEPGLVYAYIGTSGWVAFTSESLGDPDTGVITLAHPQAERYVQVAPLLTAGGNFEWIRDLFGADDYSDLIHAALEEPPASVLYLPYLNGERTPFHDPDARGAFVGLTRQTTRNHLYRAVLEGVVYAYRHAIDALLGKSPSRLVLTGGGTRSQGLCQLFADATQTQVLVASDAENTGLRGAMLSARVGQGDLDRYVFGDQPTSSQLLAPDDRAGEHYDEQYHHFRELYPALKPVFTAMADRQPKV